ncbi:hypothetical protein F5Y04DRAFT_254966 [Hypomontagnella monticulosa]|nr:hypothetical protein F5Y04DRAFT_254966 [Hypomontagnella monticulosa]
MATTPHQIPELISIGGPLFRNPNISHEDFSSAWHRHAQLVAPWFLTFGVVEYTQIHLPSPNSPNGPVGNPEVSNESAAHRLLRQADGVAFVRCRLLPTAEGRTGVFGNGGAHPYFAQVIAVDERRFLHEESGATAVTRERPAYEVPALGAEAWRDVALAMGGVEYVKIREGRDAIEGSWWDEWERVEREAGIVTKSDEGEGLTKKA